MATQTKMTRAGAATAAAQVAARANTAAVRAAYSAASDRDETPDAGQQIKGR